VIEFASGQITGRRAAQEDALDVLRLDGLPTAECPEPTPLNAGIVMVVADGMGGHVGGRVASTICVRSFLESVRGSSEPWDRRLEAGLNAANTALGVEAEAHPELAGMGSTLVGAVVSEDGLGWISIGDSALYHFNGTDLTRLNEDHSFGAYLDQQARDGLMTPEAAANDRRRNHLFYALLGDDLDHFERFSSFRQLGHGDLVLLASDGLKTLPDERLARILGDHAGLPVANLVAALLAAVDAEDRERQVNVSVIAARVGPPRTTPDRIGREAPTAQPLTAGRGAETLAAIPPDAVRSEARMDAVIVPARNSRLRWAGIAVIAVVVVGVIAIGVSQFL